MFLGLKDPSDVRIILSNLKEKMNNPNDAGQTSMAPPNLVSNNVTQNTNTANTTNTTNSNVDSSNTNYHSSVVIELRAEIARLKIALDILNSTTENASSNLRELERKNRLLNDTQLITKERHEETCVRLKGRADDLERKLEQEKNLRVQAEERIKAMQELNTSNKKKETSSLKKELELQKIRLKERRKKLEENEKLSLERTFAMNLESTKMREEVETYQHELDEEKILLLRERATFENEKRELYETNQMFMLEKKVETMERTVGRRSGGEINGGGGGEGGAGAGGEGGGELSPIGAAMNTPARSTNVFSSSRMSLLGSVIRIPEHDVDVSQEADELLTVLDRLIAETQGAMTEGMTPTKSDEDGTVDSSSPSSALMSSSSSSSSSSSPVKSASEAGRDPRQNLLTSVTPLLLTTNATSINNELMQRGEEEEKETLERCAEQLQTAIQYRDSHHRNDSDAVLQMQPVMASMAQAYRAKLLSVTGNSAENGRGGGGGGGGGEGFHDHENSNVDHRQKRLERGLITLWQMYDGTKGQQQHEQGLFSSLSSSRLLATGGGGSGGSGSSSEQRTFIPLVGSPLRFGGDDESGVINMSDLRLPSSVPTTPHQRNDSIASNASSNGGTPVNWDRVQSLVAQTGEQLAVQQSMYQEQLETVQNEMTEKVQSELFFFRFCLFFLL